MQFIHLVVFSLCGVLLAGCSVPFIKAPPPETKVTQPAENIPQVPEPDITVVSQASRSSESGLILSETMKNDGSIIVVGVGNKTLDEETLADNLVLQNADQVPPEDPGVMIQPQEPVFDFPVIENKKVQYFIDYYTGRAKKTFTLWLERSGRYLPMMRDIFADAGLPEDLAYLAMVESGFNAKAYSWAHAVGPWQFISGTGKRYGLKKDWWYDERRDPEKATRAAANFLSDLYEDFDGDWYLAVASYNAGPGKLRNAIKRYKTRDFWEICKGKYLKNETKNYVPKLLAVLLIAKQPEKYGFTDLEYQEPLKYDKVTLPSSTDIDVVARLSGHDYQTIKNLNPELKRWCTPPGVKDYVVRLPYGSQTDFVAKYTELPERERANYVRHKVKSGDTLLALSKRYGVRVKDIERLNRVRNARTIQIGTNLIIPLNPDAGGKKALASLKDDYKRSKRKYYTVRSGDSLWTISRKFNVSEKQLRVWNRLGWSNVIRPGQRLVVSSRAAKGKVNVSKSAGPLQKVVYKVRPGDTLWDIGREFAVRTSQIRTWNNLTDNHVLKPGQRLTLHVSKSRG